jgi:sulfur carrier protein
MEIIVNGHPREVADGLTLAALLAQLEITVRHVAVEVNRQLVPRGRHQDYRLAAGDRLEVVTLVGGG